MRALIVQQDPTETAGALTSGLVERGFSLEPMTVLADVEDPTSEAVYPDPTEYDLIVPMGSPWSVYDPRAASWVSPQLDMLRAAVDGDIPVLGVCFGGQLLAAACGGTVSPGPRVEIGWCQVDSEVEAVDGEWFQWHKDVIESPPGATELAWSPVSLQVFRIGRSVGLQFHPEIDADHLRGWVDDGAGPSMVADGVDLETLISETAARDESIRRRVASLLDWYLGEVAGLISVGGQTPVAR